MKAYFNGFSKKIKKTAPCYIINVAIGFNHNLMFLAMLF